jgi:Zn ribbon nucleic-acid-binding protein
MGLLRKKDQSAEPRGEVVDLTEEQPAPPPEASPPRQRFGQPGRCPSCSGRGFLDRIDMIDRVMYQHCVECGHSWEIAESELATQQ